MGSEMWSMTHSAKTVGLPHHTPAARMQDTELEDSVFPSGLVLFILTLSVPSLLGTELCALYLSLRCVLRLLNLSFLCLTGTYSYGRLP